MLLATLFGSSSASADPPVVVPITLQRNFPLVTVSIDGNDLALVFDSGNSGSAALTRAAIDRIKALPSGETSRSMDLKGNILEYPKFKIPRLQIGTAVFTDVIVELDVHDPSYPAAQVGQQGFLGTSLLKGHEVVIDYRHRKMTLVRPGGGQEQSVGCAGAAVSFSRAWHGEPVTEAETDLGRLTLWWDTGTPTSILSKRFAAAAASHQSGDTVTSKRLALGGTDFGPLQFKLEDLTLPPPGFDGLVGYNFFAHHVVCMDFPGSRLLIQR